MALQEEEIEEEEIEEEIEKLKGNISTYEQIIKLLYEYTESVSKASDEHFDKFESSINIQDVKMFLFKGLSGEIKNYEHFIRVNDERLTKLLSQIAK
jgi:flagellar biosynthesis chaperone FliJ